ncbi:NAD(P)/FAD-dependent oxidoreductase [Cohnella candidum]|nr:FAD-binding oxidoreductase [Cohnella candidum]
MTHARQPRHLHDGTLYWPKTMSTAPSYPVLKQRISTEVAIVGGGITGAICAAVLARHGVPAVLIEGQHIASGSTAANTGLVQFANDVMLSDLIDRIGENDAVRFYQACRKAVVALAQLSADTGEDIGYYTRSSLYCASCEDDVAKLIREYSMLRKHDFPVTWGIPSKVGGEFAKVKAGGLVTHGDAEMNPVRMAHALVSYAAKRGVQVFENTGVLEVGRLNGKFTVLCAEGEIVAEHVVKATGYLPGIVTQAASSAPILKRTYALVTPPGQIPEEWPEHYMMWETARPYLYFRTTPDGRILAGGSDEAMPDTGCDAKILQDRTEGLLAQLRELFPRQDWTAEHAWCGMFGESADDLPMIGEHAEQPGIFHALGVGGNGTVYSMIAASMLRDRILGRDNPLTPLLSPSRNQQSGSSSISPYWPSSSTQPSTSMFA